MNKWAAAAEGLAAVLKQQETEGLWWGEKRRRKFIEIEFGYRKLVSIE